MATFISKLESNGSGPRLAIKDLIDVAGSITTAGSKAVADFAEPARIDAALLRGFRDRGWSFIGKTNLHELAFGTTGINAWSGTPTNPLDPALVPGGSSSGSAVAVANDEAEIALGSDTGGSIRIPAAFCGVTGLKTTFGRISLDGVWPLAASLDTVGPMAKNIAGLITAMEILVPGFAARPGDKIRIARLRLPSETIDPVIDRAVDDALRRGPFEVLDLVIPEWGDAWAQCSDLLTHEAWTANRRLLAPDRESLLSTQVRERLITGSKVSPAALAAARSGQQRFRARLSSLFDDVQALALPTTAMFAPPLNDQHARPLNRLTNPVNFAGLPAVSLPITAASALPASLQLVGPHGGEEVLLGAALAFEKPL